MQLYTLGERFRSSSIVFRMFSSLFAYGCLFFVLDVVVNFILITVNVFTSTDVGAALAWFGIIIFTLLFYRMYLIVDEKLNLSEMKNFAFAAMTFGNYFRLQDAETRDTIGTHRMKTIYEEVHGRPFTGDILATPFDQRMTTFKKVPVEALKEVKRKLPPEYQNEISSLQQQIVTDVSDSFRFELIDNRTHSFFVLMTRCMIDPVQRELTIDLLFPAEKMVLIDIPAERARLIERVYESLQILIDQTWFSLYVQYISFIIILSKQKFFNEMMVDEERPIMQFRISLHQLRLHASRITTGTEIQRIATIQFSP